MRVEKLCAWAALIALIAGSASADSTINTDLNKRHAYSANTGWINWNWDTAAPNGGEGAVVTDYFLSGYVYSANLGWINLGDGTPANGIRYQNATAGGGVDFGVNHDGAGKLSGFAYSANAGWINFGPFPPAWPTPPVINLKTGRFGGYAYGANFGWIDLGENAVSAVVTNSIVIGPDTDGDGIADAWELEKVLAAGMASGTPATDLMLLTATGDLDNDGEPDVEEFIADSDPFEETDFLQILSITRSATLPQADIKWSSSERRLYDLFSTITLSTIPPTPWGLVGMDLMPDAGSSTVVTAPDSTAVRRFWQVRARRPLAP